MRKSYRTQALVVNPKKNPVCRQMMASNSDYLRGKVCELVKDGELAMASFAIMTILGKTPVKDQMQQLAAVRDRMVDGWYSHLNWVTEKFPDYWQGMVVSHMACGHFQQALDVIVWRFNYKGR